VEEDFWQPKVYRGKTRYPSRTCVLSEHMGKKGDQFTVHIQHPMRGMTGREQDWRLLFPKDDVSLSTRVPVAAVRPRRLREILLRSYWPLTLDLLSACPLPYTSCDTHTHTHSTRCSITCEQQLSLSQTHTHTHNTRGVASRTKNNATGTSDSTRWGIHLIEFVLSRSSVRTLSP